MQAGAIGPRGFPENRTRTAGIIGLFSGRALGCGRPAESARAVAAHGNRGLPSPVFWEANRGKEGRRNLSGDRREKAMRICLINPSNPLATVVRVNQNRWNRFRVWKPLGLMVLAGLTPPEWQISIVDENLGAPDYAALPRPDLVGITAFTSQANRAYEVAAYFRRRGVPVVMGGIHATTCADEVMERVDAVVTGEAETVWRRVLDDVGHGNLQRRYDGGARRAERSPAGAT